MTNAERAKKFYWNYKLKYGVRPRYRRPKPRYKPGSRTKLTGGVLKRDGYYLAHISVCGDTRQKKYNIKRLGETGARLAASLQRLAWVIELGVWNPNDGDPFSILNIMDQMKGNRDYENSVVDDIPSPWVHQKNDE